jgi:predicted homoserine dehydrogenase-like protein
LERRESDGRPIKVGVIGAGVYGSMFLSQLRFTPGMQLVGVAELDITKAKDRCIRAGWPEEALFAGKSASVINDGVRNRKIALVEDSSQLIQAELDVIVEVTGIAEAGARHTWDALEAGKHVVIVTVETDAVVGMALKELADKKRLVYSLGYGDEPACLCELVDWARTAGFEVVSAGKCVSYKAEKRYSTPDTGWKYYGLSEEQVATGEYNLKMYNSFADGTKSVTEMCAVANACDLTPQSGGLKYPAIEYDDLPAMLRPTSEGGTLEHSGTIEILASEKPDGTPLKKSLRWGIYVAFRGRSDFVKHYLQNFAMEHRIKTDTEYGHSIMYRPTHLIGLELGISVASVGLLDVPTGTPSSYVADVVAVAKKNLKPGEVLDGEGGYTVYGQLTTAGQSLDGRYLPIGLSNKAKLLKHVSRDTIITYDDVELDENSFLYRLRKQVEERSRKKK